MVSKANFNRGGQRSTPWRAIIYQCVNSDIMNFLLITNDERYRRPNFAIWSASYALTKPLKREGSISSSRLYGQLIFTRFVDLSSQ